MWKVVIIICALGNPCVIMQEKPKQFYQDRDQCMEVARAKHEQLMVAFKEHGYIVQNTSLDCEELPVT
jgi:hypothetical protein|tara:strand:+ start:1188 stop:1391 length:204 start_codon:yes stop_codon:yes gene_type:complete